MICPNCQQSDLDDSDIFCSNCGADLQSVMKIQKYNTSKIDLVSQLNSSQSSSLKLTQQTIIDYQNLTQEINDLQDIPQKLAMNQQQLQFMKTTLAKNSSLLKNLNDQLAKEKKDVDKLKSLSMTSIIARMKGDKEEKLKKEEEEYLAVLNKIEALNKDISIQKDEINKVSSHIRDLQNLNVRLQKNRDTLEKLIHQTTNGVPDPVEDKIEMEMERLMQEYDPIQSQIHTKQKVSQYLDSAYSDLNYAYSQLKSASNYADWDTFFGGGMFVDSIKHSKMSDARDAVNRGRNNINLARNLDSNIPGVNAFVEDISFFWDGFFDNIFSDWSSRNKIHNSLSSVQSALNQLANVRTRIHYEISGLQAEINSLNNQVESTKAQLLNERTRMIEDAIKRQDSSLEI